VTRAHAKSFYFASSALGPARRRGACAVYAFCRRADDAIDEASGAPDVRQLATRVDALRARLDRVYSHAPLDDAPELAALRDTVRRFGIEREPFDRLVDGVASDARDPVRIATLEELDAYCDAVAGTVGWMMARLFGIDDDAARVPAAELGRAMQLTNVLRDVREDWVARRRVYLPATLLRAHGVALAELDGTRASPGLRAVARALGARARALYRASERGVPRIVSPGGRVATVLMARAYEGILDVLEARGWDVLAGRAVVSRGAKLKLAARALVAMARAGGG
jgi:phytoene synthase